MKITVEGDDGKETVYQFVTDAFLALRQLEDGQNSKGDMAKVIMTRSYSWGGNLRDLVKEIHQAEIELQALIVRGSAQ